jgi:hypothetical protein
MYCNTFQSTKIEFYTLEQRTKIFVFLNSGQDHVRSGEEQVGGLVSGAPYLAHYKLWY